MWRRLLSLLADAAIPLLRAGDLMSQDLTFIPSLGIVCCAIEKQKSPKMLSCWQVAKLLAYGRRAPALITHRLFSKRTLVG